MKKSSQEIIVPPNVVPVDDPRTHAKSIFFPFVYKDGTNGVIILTRLKGLNWKPADLVKSIVINHNEDSTN